MIETICARKTNPDDVDDDNKSNASIKSNASNTSIRWVKHNHQDRDNTPRKRVQFNWPSKVLNSDNDGSPASGTTDQSIYGECDACHNYLSEHKKTASDDEDYLVYSSSNDMDSVIKNNVRSPSPATTDSS